MIHTYNIHGDVSGAVRSVLQPVHCILDTADAFLFHAKLSLFLFYPSVQAEFIS
jgi:hypothetical protein